MDGFFTVFDILISIGLGAPLGLFLILQNFFVNLNVYFLIFVGCPSWDRFFRGFIFLVSIGLGAPLGLFLILQNLFC